jgi:hypothetical protein
MSKNIEKDWQQIAPHVCKSMYDEKQDCLVCDVCGKYMGNVSIASERKSRKLDRRLRGRPRK